MKVIVDLRWKALCVLTCQAARLPWILPSFHLLWATWCGEHAVRSAPFFVGSVIKMEYTIYHSFSSKTSPTKLLGFWTTTSTGYLDLLSVFLLAKHLMSSCGIGGSSKQVILYEILKLKTFFCSESSGNRTRPRKLCLFLLLFVTCMKSVQSCCWKWQQIPWYWCSEKKFWPKP